MVENYIPSLYRTAGHAPAMPLPAADSTDADLCLKVLLPCSRRCRNGADSEEPDSIQRVAEALELFVLKDHLAEQFTFTVAKTDGVELTSSALSTQSTQASQLPPQTGAASLTDQVPLNVSIKQHHCVLWIYLENDSVTEHTLLKPKSQHILNDAGFS